MIDRFCRSCFLPELAPDSHFTCLQIESIKSWIFYPYETNCSSILETQKPISDILTTCSILCTSDTQYQCMRSQKQNYFKMAPKWKTDNERKIPETFRFEFTGHLSEHMDPTWTPHGPLGSPTLNAVNIVIICFYVYKCSFPVMFIFIATCLNVNNCTSPIHGACKTTDVCQCNPGYIGNKKFILLFFGFFV